MCRQHPEAYRCQGDGWWGGGISWLEVVCLRTVTMHTYTSRRNIFESLRSRMKVSQTFILSFL